MDCEKTLSLDKLHMEHNDDGDTIINMATFMWQTVPIIQTVVIITSDTQYTCNQLGILQQCITLTTNLSYIHYCELHLVETTMKTMERK